MAGGSAYGNPYGFAYGGGDPVPVGDGAPPIDTDTPPFAGDALFFHTSDGGDVRIHGGEPARAGGLYAAAYLSMWGGNDLDSGASKAPHEWWGNKTETDPAYKYRGRTQYVLRTRPMVLANIPVVEAAAESDLAWMLAHGVADSVTDAATITGPKRITVEIEITADGVAETFEFDANWSARS